MPQDPFAGLPDQGKDPFAGLPDVNEPSAPLRTPDQMNDLERQVLGLPPNKQELSWYDPDYWIPMGLRTIPAIGGGILGGTAGSVVPFAGTMAGTAVGGAGGSFLGENLAQGYEMLRGTREHYNPYSVAVNTGLGAIPSMGKAPGISAGAKELMKYAIKAPVMGAVEGGVLGGASTVPQQLAETGELPTLGQVGTGTAVGAGIGAVTGGAMGSYPAVRKARGMRPPIAAPAAPIDLPLNVQMPHEFAPIDTPTAASTPIVHPPAPTVVKAPVNPLRPEIPPGQLTNQDMANVLTTRAAQETIPPVPEAPAVPHEFAPVDPNLNQGIGDPELAGYTPYSQTPEPVAEPAFNPNTVSREHREMIDRMDDASLEDFLNRQGNNPGWTGSESGQKALKYAQMVLDDRRANPPVEIKPPAPEPAATNITPEQAADIESWYRFKKMYDEGKIPDDPNHPLVQQWAAVHNRVKDLKPNGSVTVSPYRFEQTHVEPPPFTEYTLPDGTKVNLDTSATKGAETTSFQMKDGTVVEARRSDLDASVPPDDVQFVDPNTGEIKPASQAKPGDVLLPREESNTGQSSVPPVKPPTRNSTRFGLAGVEQGQGGGGNLPPRNPPFDTSGYIPPEGTPPIRDPRLAGARQIELPGTAQPQPAQFPENYSRPFESTGQIPHGMKQTRFEGMEPSRQGLVTEDKIRPGIKVVRRKPQKLHEQTLLGKIWDTPRSLQSIDAPGITSAALRQARPLAFTADWFKAWGRAFGSFNSKEALDAMNNAIKENKYFKPQFEARYNQSGELTHYVEKPSLAEKAGLLMSDVINNREDAIRSSLAEKIPGYGRYVKASNRAYTAFLNHLRVTKFEQMMDAAIIQGRGNDDVLQKKIADFVNNATGRGSLKFGSGKYSINLESKADELGHLLYSPRALAARLAFMNPSNYITADPMIRKEYWKGMSRMIASWAGFAGLGTLAGGEVGTDPTSSDFGKVRFGNRRIDPGAGWLQLMHIIGKEYYGGTTSSTPPMGKGEFTRFGENAISGSRWTPAQRYLYNQLNPATRYVVDLIGATKRESFDLTDRTLQLVAPMFLDDIAQAAQEDDTVMQVFSGLLGSMGIGGQTYEKGDFGKPTLTPAIETITGWEPPTVVFGGKKK